MTKKLKPSAIRTQNMELFLQLDEEGNAGYIRVAHVVDGQEEAYLGALDKSNKKQLVKLQTFIKQILAPKKGKKKL